MASFSVFGLLARLLLILLLASGCGPSLKLVENSFYGYDALSAELESLQTDFKNVITVEPIGRTYEGRSILAVGLVGNPQSLDRRPALMAVFTEHGCEHDVTNLGMGIIKYLSDNYGKDHRITNLLNKTEVWIVPLMNPDGSEYDLSGSVTPFSWRKNRRPTGPRTCGVDLNRNWEYNLSASIPNDQMKRLSDRESCFFGGDAPFSEAETRAVRDFLLSHPNIQVFMDYHSGFAGFMQGGIVCQAGRPSVDNVIPDIGMRCEKIVEPFADAVTDPEDKRPGFLVANRADAAELLRQRVPLYLKPFVPAGMFKEPGTAVRYVGDQLGILAVGIEIFRDRDFWSHLPDSQDRMLKSQIRGLLFLLDALADKHAADQK